MQKEKAKPCYSNKKHKDHRLAHEKALCILNNFNDYGDALFESNGDNSEDEMEKYLEEGEVDTAFLGDRKKEDEFKPIIEYESENEFNTGIGNATLVSEETCVFTESVAGIPGSQVSSIVTAAKVVKRREQPLKTKPCDKPLTSPKRYGRPKKNTVAVSSPKPSEKRKCGRPTKESTF